MIEQEGAEDAEVRKDDFTGAIAGSVSTQVWFSVLPASWALGFDPRPDLDWESRAVLLSRQEFAMKRDILCVLCALLFKSVTAGLPAAKVVGAHSRPLLDRWG